LCMSDLHVAKAVDSFAPREYQMAYYLGVSMLHVSIQYRSSHVLSGFTFYQSVVLLPAVSVHYNYSFCLGSCFHSREFC